MRLLAMVAFCSILATGWAFAIAGLIVGLLGGNSD